MLYTPVLASSFPTAWITLSAAIGKGVSRYSVQSNSRLLTTAHSFIEGSGSKNPFHLQVTTLGNRCQNLILYCIVRAAEMCRIHRHAENRWQEGLIYAGIRNKSKYIRLYFLSPKPPSPPKKILYIYIYICLFKSFFYRA